MRGPTGMYSWSTRFSFVNGLRVNENNHAFAIALRVPLANLTVEIEFHRCPDLIRHDAHDLLRDHSLFGCHYDHHFADFRYRHPGRAWGDSGL